MNRTKIGDFAECQVERALKSQDNLAIWSTWTWEHYRQGKKINQWTEPNVCTDQGINRVLNTAFSAGTQDTAWYIAIFDNNYTPATGSTYGTPGFTENTEYSEANRPTWQEGGVSAKQITNAANKASFTFTTSATIYGAALVNDNSKGNTTAADGVVFCVSQFTSGSKSVASSDVLKVSISIQMADT